MPYASEQVGKCLILFLHGEHNAGSEPIKMAETRTGECERQRDRNLYPTHVDW